MINLTPEIVAAIIAAIGAIGTSVGLYIRNEAKLRTQRQEHRQSLEKLAAEQRSKDADHKRDLEKMQAQITAEREHQIRMEEARVEEKLMAVFETRIKDLEDHLVQVKEERRQLRLELDTERQARQNLGKDLERETELRRNLEIDFKALSDKLTEVESQKESLRLERNNLREELSTERLAREALGVKLADTELALAELERQFRQLSKKVHEADDDNGNDPNPSEPASAVVPPSLTITDADGAKTKAQLDNDLDAA